MANIKQQKKRVGIAARQRIENLRYKSTAKTLLRALQEQVNVGDKETAAKTHRELVTLLDRAASRNALHRNTVARKKSRATRILASEPVLEAKVVRRAKKKAPLRKPKATAPEAATTTKAKTKAKAAAETAAVGAAAEETPAVEAEAAATEPEAPAVEVEAPAVEAAADEAPAAEVEAPAAEDAPDEPQAEGEQADA